MGVLKRAAKKVVDKAEDVVVGKQERKSQGVVEQANEAKDGPK